MYVFAVHDLFGSYTYIIKGSKKIMSNLKPLRLLQLGYISSSPATAVVASAKPVYDQCFLLLTITSNVAQLNLDK